MDEFFKIRKELVKCDENQIKLDMLSLSDDVIKELKDSKDRDKVLGMALRKFNDILNKNISIATTK